MPTYYFTAPGDVWDPDSEDGMEFDDLQQAIVEARIAICELAEKFLPANPMNRISITVHDANGVKQIEVRLVLEIIPGPPQD
jgi:hypothetical protein